MTDKDALKKHLEAGSTKVLLLNDLHLRDRAEQILDAMIQAIDFIERCFRREDRLDEECAFVELRHEVAADHESEGERGNWVEHGRDDGDFGRGSGNLAAPHRGATRGPRRARGPQAV